MNETVFEKLVSLLQGGIPSKIELKADDVGADRKLGETVNQLIDFMQEIHAFIVPLSRGELHGVRMQSRNFLASPFKELHSRLLHLTWQATRVAKGDYEQRVDFMGDFSEAFNSMIISLEQNEKLSRTRSLNLRKRLLTLRNWKGSCQSVQIARKYDLKAPTPKLRKVGFP
mgnify:CR=1 FL=1